MIGMEHSAKWRRQATALVSALALVLHIVFMALGALGLGALDGKADQVQAHHAASTARHDADSPAKSPGHKPPCCILGVCPLLQIFIYKRFMKRGITSRDCNNMTWLGAALLLAYHGWVLAGLPGVRG